MIRLAFVQQDTTEVHVKISVIVLQVLAIHQMESAFAMKIILALIAIFFVHAPMDIAKIMELAIVIIIIMENFVMNGVLMLIVLSIVLVILIIVMKIRRVVTTISR